MGFRTPGRPSGSEGSGLGRKAQEKAIPVQKNGQRICGPLVETGVASLALHGLGGIGRGGELRMGGTAREESASPLGLPSTTWRESSWRLFSLLAALANHLFLSHFCYLIEHKARLLN